MVRRFTAESAEGAEGGKKGGGSVVCRGEMVRKGGGTLCDLWAKGIFVLRRVLEYKDFRFLTSLRYVRNDRGVGALRLFS